MAKKNQNGNLALADLKKGAAEITKYLDGVPARLPEAHLLPDGDRRASQGKMGLEEGKALRCMPDAMDLEPAIFGVLADEDEGDDPGKLETNLIRERFERWQVYLELSNKLGELSKLFADAAITAGAQVKPVCQAGYEIAKPISKRHKGMRAAIGPLLNYYGANAAAAAESRLANKAAKAKPGNGEDEEES